MQFDGAIPLIGDIRNISDIEKACEGIDTVFQTASIIWNPQLPVSLYYDTNVKGNQNVIDVCKKFRIPRLIYTSTLDVLVDGFKPISDGNDEMSLSSKNTQRSLFPHENSGRKSHSRSEQSRRRILHMFIATRRNLWSRRQISYWQHSHHGKKQSESEIRKWFCTIQFRLCGKCCPCTYRSCKTLHSNSTVSGNAYIISDSTPPTNFFIFLNDYLKALSFPPLTKSIPGGLAFGIAGIAEIFAPKAKFNRFSVAQTCRDHVFIGLKQKPTLVTPIVTEEEAFTRTVEWFKENW